MDINITVTTDTVEETPASGLTDKELICRIIAGLLALFITFGLLFSDYSWQFLIGFVVLLVGAAVIRLIAWQ